MFWQNKIKNRVFGECLSILDILRKWLLRWLDPVFHLPYLLSLNTKYKDVSNETGNGVIPICRVKIEVLKKWVFFEIDVAIATQ